MKLASIFSIARPAFFAALAASTSTDYSVAQQKMTRDQLVGAWTIMSCATANGGKPAACVEPQGGMIFDVGGRFAIVWAGKHPIVPSNVTRRQRAAEDYKAVAEGLVTFFGTWSFDEPGQRFAFRTQTSLFSNGGGDDLTFSFTRSGDELRLVQLDGTAGKGNTYVFRRAP